MKINLLVSSLLLVILGSSSALAQTNVVVNRSRACSINPGYSMADVVATARSFDWPEETAPGVVVFQEAVAAAGTFQNDYDFLFSAYYLSYTDMVEKRGAFRRRSGGRTGLGFSDVATCSDGVRISSVRFASPRTGPIPSVSLSASTACQLNGATVADAVNLASSFEQNLEARAAVVSRTFGGPRFPMNSGVGIRIFFPSAADFGAALDRVQQNTPTPNQENPISCSNGSLWVTHLIHARNN